jgi:Protein of unknown function (DUF2865)
MNPNNGDMSGYKTQARRRYGLAAVVAAVALLAACPVLAQGWWPWSNDRPEHAPIPQEPVYKDPEPEERTQDQGAPPPAAPPTANWSTKNPICLQLEQRLVQESQRSSQTRDALPQIEAETRQVDQALQAAKYELDRRRCYEYFLFSKTLRRTRACVDLANQAEQAERRMSELDTRRQQIKGSSERSYRDDIVRELARNNCGANYTQEARRQDRGIFSSIWQDEEGGGGNYGNNWAPSGGPQSSATYRTVCVRLCDGYYFPVSFSTLPSHFEQDENVCHSKCAAPVELYYYQNPGATVDQSVALRSQEPYTTLKTAFRYRKEMVAGCSCKEAEFVPKDATGSAPGSAPQSTHPGGKRAEDDADGWAARSELEATSR